MSDPTVSDPTVSDPTVSDPTVFDPTVFDPTNPDAPTTVISVRPLVLPAPERGEDLQVRVSAPATGTGLPVIVFSHGFSLSMNDYAPLADYWAARGFVVLRTLVLTEHGYELWAALRTRLHASGLFAGLDAREQHTLLALLRKMRNPQRP